MKYLCIGLLVSLGCTKSTGEGALTSKRALSESVLAIESSEASSSVSLDSVPQVAPEFRKVQRVADSYRGVLYKEGLLLTEPSVKFAELPFRKVERGWKDEKCKEVLSGHLKVGKGHKLGRRQRELAAELEKTTLGARRFAAGGKIFCQGYFRIVRVSKQDGDVQRGVSRHALVTVDATLGNITGVVDSLEEKITSADNFNLDYDTYVAEQGDDLWFKLELQDEGGSPSNTYTGRFVRGGSNGFRNIHLVKPGWLSDSNCQDLEAGPCQSRMGVGQRGMCARKQGPTVSRYLCRRR